MEFEDVGKHCSVPQCNQKDFLPFTCSVCRLSYCLDHRHFSQHDCIGDQLRDVFSLDCPICFNSIKYNKAQDIDMVWNDHFLNSCSQVPNESQNRPKEICLQCKISLGPSNRYVCQKCNKLLCLSHRNVDDHACIILTRKSVGNGSSMPINKSSTTQPSIQGSSKVTVTSQVTKPAVQSGRDVPPLRNEAFLNKVESSNKSYGNNKLQSSTKRNQMKPTNVSTVNSSKPSNEMITQSPDPQEACPICSLMFQSPVDLVDHFELYHNNTVSSNQEVRQTQTSPNNSMSNLGNSCVIG